MGIRTRHYVPSTKGDMARCAEITYGVFQWSEISAIMLTIYLGDMVEDYESLNLNAKLPTRKTIQRGTNTENAKLLEHIARTQKN